MQGAHNLSDRQARLMVDHFMHYVQPGDRARLMRELPEAYNAYCARRIVIVKILNDEGERIV